MMNTRHLTSLGLVALLCGPLACGGDDNDDNAGGGDGGGGSGAEKTTHTIDSATGCRGKPEQVAYRFAGEFKMTENSPTSCLLVDFGPGGKAYEGLTTPAGVKLLGVANVPKPCAEAKKDSPQYLTVKTAAGSMTAGEDNKLSIDLTFDVGAPHLIQLKASDVDAESACSGKTGDVPMTQLSGCKASEAVPVRIGADFKMMGKDKCMVFELGAGGTSQDDLTITPASLLFIKIGTAAGACSAALADTVEAMTTKSLTGTIGVADDKASVDIMVDVGAPHKFNLKADDVDVSKACPTSGGGSGAGTGGGGMGGG